MSLIAFDTEASIGIKLNIYTDEKHAAQELFARYYPHVTDADQKKYKIRDLIKRIKKK